MSTAYVKYPQLNQEQMQRVKELEQDLGTWVVAVEPTAKVAELSPEKLRELQEAEKELGMILLAYRRA